MEEELLSWTMGFIEGGIVVVDNANVLNNILTEEELLSWTIGFMEGGIVVVDDANLLNNCYHG